MSKLRFGELVTCPNPHSESVAESEPKFECPDFQSSVWNSSSSCCCHHGLSAHLLPSAAEQFTQAGQDGSSGRDQTDRTQTTPPAPVNYMLLVDITTPSLLRRLSPVFVLSLAICVVISFIPLKLPFHNIIYHKNNNIMSVKGIWKNHAKPHHPSPTAVLVFLSSSNLCPYACSTHFYTLVIAM